MLYACMSEEGCFLSRDHYYNLCQKHVGRCVEIRTNDGRVHRGRIRSVDRRYVYMEPLGARGRGLGGLGYGYYGGYGRGAGFSIALGFITGLVLFPLLFW